MRPAKKTTGPWAILATGAARGEVLVSLPSFAAAMSERYSAVTPAPEFVWQSPWDSVGRSVGRRVAPLASLAWMLAERRSRQTGWAKATKIVGLLAARACTREGSWAAEKLVRRRHNRQKIRIGLGIRSLAVRKKGKQAVGRRNYDSLVGRCERQKRSAAMTDQPNERQGREGGGID